MEIFSKEFSHGLTIIDSLNNRYPIAVNELIVPRSYAVKILKRLISQKAVTSKEGRGGGYKLAVPKKVAVQRLVSNKKWQQALHAWELTQ